MAGLEAVHALTLTATAGFVQSLGVVPGKVPRGTQIVRIERICADQKKNGRMMFRQNDFLGIL
jgi:hypothetical protein